MTRITTNELVVDFFTLKIVSMAQQYMEMKKREITGEEYILSLYRQCIDVSDIKTIIRHNIQNWYEANSCS